MLGYEKMLAVAKLEKEFEFLQKEKEAEIYRLKNVELVRARERRRPRTGPRATSLQ